MFVKTIVALSLIGSTAAVQASSGCAIEANAELFTSTPTHNSQPPANWNTTLANFHHVQGSATSLNTYTILPDGKLSFIPYQDNNGSTTWDLYFGNYTNEKVNHHTLDLETFNTSDIRNVLELRHGFNGSVPNTSWHSGGGWLMSVHDVGGDNRVGYLHGEDWYCDLTNSGDCESAISHKSVGYTCSTDGGETWSDPTMILESHERPASPEWSGLGDGQFVWDFQHDRWVAFFQNYSPTHNNAMISAAMTEDKTLAGGWKKWDGSNFIVNAMTTGNEKAYGYPVNTQMHGANPSVSWNTYLNKWVMVYGSWEGDILISYADTLPKFSNPTVLISKNNVDGMSVFKARYPTLVSPETGSEITGKNNKLYFRIDIDGDMSNMQFMQVDLNFAQADSDNGGSDGGSLSWWLTLLLMSIFGWRTKQAH